MKYFRIIFKVMLILTTKHGGNLTLLRAVCSLWTIALCVSPASILASETREIEVEIKMVNPQSTTFTIRVDQGAILNPRSLLLIDFQSLVVFKVLPNPKVREYTDSDGNYWLIDVPSGEHRIRVIAFCLNEGFKAKAGTFLAVTGLRLGGKIESQDQVWEDQKRAQVEKPRRSFVGRGKNLGDSLRSAFRSATKRWALDYSEWDFEIQRDGVAEIFRKIDGPPSRRDEGELSVQKFKGYIDYDTISDPGSTEVEIRAKVSLSRNFFDSYD